MAKLNRNDLEKLCLLYEEYDAIRRRLIIFMNATKTMEITMGGIRVKIEDGDDDIRKLVVGYLAKLESATKDQIEALGFDVLPFIPSEEPTDA